MPVNPQNIKLGPCKVTWDVEGTPVVLETTKGGVTLKYTESTKTVTVDQYGDTPVDELVIGRQAEINVPFAESDLTKLSKLIPGATLVTNGTDPSKKRVDILANNVISLFDAAKKLKLEPLSSKATPNDAVILYKAGPRVELDLKYSYDGELIYNVTFKGYPDTDGKLISFGDEDA